MSVAGSIASALQRFGRPMVLTRVTALPNGDKSNFGVTVYGRTKNLSAQDGPGDVSMTRVQVTITNAEIEAHQWPGPPKKGDKITIDDRVRTIEGDVEPKYLGAEVLVFVFEALG